MSRVINRPQSRICPGNERKSPGVRSRVFRYVLTYDGTRLKCLLDLIFFNKDETLLHVRVYKRIFLLNSDIGRLLHCQVDD